MYLADIHEYLVGAINAHQRIQCLLELRREQLLAVKAVNRHYDAEEDVHNYSDHRHHAVGEKSEIIAHSRDYIRAQIVLQVRETHVDHIVDLSTHIGVFLKDVGDPYGNIVDV